MKTRLDQLLVQMGTAPSRTKAQELLERGSIRIFINAKEILNPKASDRYEGDELRFEIAEDENLLKYVSRGGLKLESALKRLSLEVKNLKCLDIGISTGGFADVLLQGGACRVDGIDVGVGQLAERLHSEVRLRAYSKVHVRDLPKHPVLMSETYDLIVVDVSFISLDKVLPIISNFFSPKGRLLALVKPQFELEASDLNKNGIVKSDSNLEKVRAKLARLATECGYQVLEYFPCEEKGRDGNQEFFLYAKK